MAKVPRVSEKMPIRAKTQRAISAEYARKHNLDVLTTTEYASRFFVTQQCALHRIRKRKIQAFKSKGKWLIVIPKESKTGLEYAY